MQRSFRTTPASAALTAVLFAILAMPSTAGTTQVEGVGVFNNACSPPVGSPPANLGDYPPIEMSGSLEGCWYTYVSASRFNPSGTYIEQGTELFVGCFGTACGTFDTVYTFTGKYTDDTFAEEIHGRCEHALVDGTGDFAGVKGSIKFKDDVVNLKFDWRGHITLDSATGKERGNDVQTTAKAGDAGGALREEGC